MQNPSRKCFSPPVGKFPLDRRCAKGVKAMIAKCKKCGADIKWCMMGTGAKVPLNVTPQKLIQVKYGIGELIDVYESHFAACSGGRNEAKQSNQNGDPAEGSRERGHLSSRSKKG